MGTEDKKRQFDEIVEHLTAEYPSLNRPVQRLPRWALITLAVLGALVWGLLSVAMVAWGATGIMLTCAVVALTAMAAGMNAWHSRHH